jgi:hypothetical protein
MTKHSSLVSIASLAIALTLSAAPTTATAAPTQAAQDKLARLHFEAGKQAYELGRFADAAIEFQRGYDLSKLPLFLLNLGHSYFALDRFEDAIKACEQYLALNPNDPVHVREAEDLLTSAQRHKQLQAPTTPPPVSDTPPPPVTTEAAPPPPPPPVNDTPPRRGPAHPALGWTGVVGMVVGAGLIAGGAVLLVDAGNLNDEFNHPAPGTVYNHNTISRFQTDQAAGIGLVVTGGAVLVAGAVATIIGFRHAPEAPSSSAWWIAPSLAPTAVGAVSGFRF